MIRYFALALVLVALVVGIVFYLNRGSQVRLEGSVVKVRTIATGDDASLAVLELRIANPARTPFVVREATLSILQSNGEQLDGLMASQVDLDRTLGYFPTAGPRYNEVLRARSQIAGGSKGDWTIAAAFPLAEASLAARKNFLLTIQDVDGVVVSFNER